MSQEFREDERLADWVDGRMTAAEREAFEAEVHSDPAKRAVAEEYRDGVEMLRGLGGPGPSINLGGGDLNGGDLSGGDLRAGRLTDRIMESVAAESRGSGGGSLLRMWGAVATAAAALLVWAVIDTSSDAEPTDVRVAGGPSAAPRSQDLAGRENAEFELHADRGRLERPPAPESDSSRRAKRFDASLDDRSELDRESGPDGAVRSVDTGVEAVRGGGEGSPVPPVSELDEKAKREEARPGDDFFMGTKDESVANGEPRLRAMERSRELSQRRRAFQMLNRAGEVVEPRVVVVELPEDSVDTLALSSQLPGAGAGGGGGGNVRSRGGRGAGPATPGPQGPATPGPAAPGPATPGPATPGPSAPGSAKVGPATGGPAGGPVTGGQVPSRGAPEGRVGSVGSPAGGGGRGIGPFTNSPVPYRTPNVLMTRSQIEDQLRFSQSVMPMQGNMIGPDVQRRADLSQALYALKVLPVEGLESSMDWSVDLEEPEPLEDGSFPYVPQLGDEVWTVEGDRHLISFYNRALEEAAGSVGGDFSIQTLSYEGWTRGAGGPTEELEEQADPQADEVEQAEKSVSRDRQRGRAAAMNTQLKQVTEDLKRTVQQSLENRNELQLVVIRRGGGTGLDAARRAKRRAGK